MPAPRADAPIHTGAARPAAPRAAPEAAGPSPSSDPRSHPRLQPPRRGHGPLLSPAHAMRRSRRVPALIAAPLFLARSSAHGCVAGRSSSTICEAPALARRRTSEPEVLASAFDVEDVLGERAERHEQPAVVGTAGRELSAEVLDNRTAHRTRAALLLELDDRGLEPERVPLGDDVHAGIPDTHGSATSPAASRSAAVPAG